jgi:hypothetical protein
MSEEADPLYRPLAELDEWAGRAVDEAAFADGVARVERVVGDVGDMVRRDLLLAAAQRSVALDSVDGVEGAHVRANYRALLLARDVDELSVAAIRRVHAVACRPQLTHRVLIDDHVHDHVLAAGDYKHHPNHVLLDSGAWQARAPVALVRVEMARLVETAGGVAFAALHPLLQAGYLHDALVHVAPFEDGNGRVGRALAGGRVLRVAPIPPLFSEGASVLDAFLAAVEEFEARSGDPDRAALERWRAESEAADRLREGLVPAVEAALERYMSRPAADRRADLSAAVAEAHVIRLPVGVEEELVVDAHPLDGGPVVVTAREARVSLEAGAAMDPWLDRVVSILALRAAAEEEDQA